MKLFVTAKPNAKAGKIERVDESYFRICVKALPEDGHANCLVIEALSKYLHRPISNFKVLTGQQSRHKVIGYEPKA